MRSDVGGQSWSDAAIGSRRPTKPAVGSSEADRFGYTMPYCAPPADAAEGELLLNFDATRSCAIGVMAKAPRPGRSKTRLCPPLAYDQAAILSAAFLRDTTDNMLAATRLSSPGLQITPYAAFAPAGDEALAASSIACGVRLILADGSPSMPMGVDGFGRCLLHAMQGMLADGHASACVLSSDTPNLPTELLIEAARLLTEPGDRAVLGACEDGGYYLLGLKAPHAALFSDIVWSTDGVAVATRARAASIGLDLVELPSWYDVDDAASLRTLLMDKTGYPAPWSRSAIDCLGIAALLQDPTPASTARTSA